MKKLFSIITVVLATVYSAAAQPPPPPPPNTAISLDIIVSLLILGGVYYGYTKLKARKTAEQA